MGCCCSAEANAVETDLPPPQWGMPMVATLKKKGFFDADYNVHQGDSAEGEKWMLLDAVGSIWDDGYNYFLKHRTPGQVDENGKPTSTVLGAVNIKGEWDAFSFRVSGGDRSVEFGPFYDIWDHDIDFGMTHDKTLWACWTYSKRAILYSDYEMTQQIGWLDITGSGTWYEHEETRIVYDTDADGNRTMRHETHRVTDCKTHGFRYSFNVFNTPMVITYDKEGGGFWQRSKLNFTAANAWAPQVPLFKCISDGENNCTVESFANSDPVSTLLAAYAVSCKLDPKEFNSSASRQCDRHIRLGMPPGFSNFVGLDEASFQQRFSYPAPVPTVFAEAVASYVPAQAPPAIPFAQPVGQQPVVACAQLPQGMAVAQPMVGQPMMMAQPMAGQPQMAQPVMAQPLLS